MALNHLKSDVFFFIAGVNRNAIGIMKLANDGSRTAIVIVADTELTFIISNKIMAIQTKSVDQPGLRSKKLVNAMV